MADQTKTPSRPSWSSLRISLRWLIALILLIGCWLGWIVNEAHVQRDAVAAIRESGGGVWYDWQWKDGVTFYEGSPFWPKWLVDRLGIDYFDHPVVVYMFDPATDEVLAYIGHLRRLEVLNLDPTGVRRRPRRRTRSPSLPAVTDAGLAHLEGLTRLKSLDLGGTAVTDAGLVHLRRLSRLESLFLTGTAITDAGLSHLKGLTHLKRLHLSETAINGSGLSFLRNLSHLETLKLNRTEIDDAAMVHLESLTSLRDLGLWYDPHVTRVGLGHLKTLTNLKYLSYGDRDSDQAFFGQVDRILKGPVIHPEHYE